MQRTEPELERSVTEQLAKDTLRRCWRSHELLPKDFKHQHKQAERNDKTDQYNRDDGFRLSLRLRLTFSCGSRSV
jgi:hypothetical protein